jgi:type IV pilus assembly protein PilW
VSRRPTRGFTLIELMIAITLALFVTTALMLAVLTVSRVNRVQDGGARLLENARFALATLAGDARHGGNQFCLNYAGADGALPTGASVRVDVTKPLTALFDATGSPWHLGRPPVAAAYGVDPAELVRGVECGASCGTASRLEDFPPLANRPLPLLGTAPGDRLRGGDVVSMRYLTGNGRRLASVEGAARGDGSPARLVLAAGETAPASGAVIVADCASAYAVRVAASGTMLTFAGNFDDDVAPGLSLEQARVFDLVDEFAPITYYLRAVEATNARGEPRTVSALVRRVGDRDETLALGIERFDAMYRVETATGTTQLLNAEQVGALPAAQCRGVVTGDNFVPAPGCGWRSLEGIELYLLANSVDDVDGETIDPVLYAWRFDGTRNVAGTYEQPTTLPSGLPVGRMLRRQFRTYVALRGFNH